MTDRTTATTITAEQIAKLKEAHKVYLARGISSGRLPELLDAIPSLIAAAEEAERMRVELARVTAERDHLKAEFGCEAAMKAPGQWLAEWSASDAPSWVHNLISAVQGVSFMAGRKAGLEKAAERVLDMAAKFYPHARPPYDDAAAAILALIEKEA